MNVRATEPPRGKTLLRTWLLSAKDRHLADPTERECDRRRASFEEALWVRKEMRRLKPAIFQAQRELDPDEWDWRMPEHASDTSEENCQNGCGNSENNCRGN